jgi:two-component system cell cycle response regulator
MIDGRRPYENASGADGGSAERYEPRPGTERSLPAEPAPLSETGHTSRRPFQHEQDALSLAAHDLRGPAASLLRQVRRLRCGTRAGVEAASHALDALERQVRRVAAVSDGLLALSAMQRGQASLQYGSTELGALLARVVEAHLPAARARSVELVREAPPYPLVIPADTERLEGAVGTLVDAAVSATAPGGQVRISLEALADGARFAVEETRAGSPRARQRPAGMGTRLAVCRRVAELHGGGLEIDARGGAMATLLTLRSTEGAEDREPARLDTGQGKARLLLVDDDQDGREALAMILADDYEIYLAGDGREAVENALAVRPDIVLMDLYMPRMDGLAALEAMRADPSTEDVPVILISARGDDLTRSRSLDLGAVDFLQKPFSARELKARIDRTLRLTRRETQLQVLARTDALTGLANLRAFRTRLEEEVKRARRYRTPLACVMVDMDYLKPINDELGHGAGDLAIGAVAEVIRNELRETDFGARYGGDEFVMLLPHTSAAEARVFAERACARLHETTIDVGDRRLSLSASFGIAALGDEPLDDPGEALVRHADAALYAAKHAGRGRVAAHPSADPALSAS